MSFEIRKKIRENYILYEISGENSTQHLIELADNIFDEGTQNGVTNFILDCANIHGALSMAELFEVGNYFASKLMTYKLAGINTPPEWRNNKFSENVVHNRGGQLEHFKSIEDAEQWFSKM